MKLFAAAGLALSAIVWGAWSPANAQAQAATAKLCDNPRQMDGFKTCANVEKAKAEGAFTLYSTDPEQGQVKLLAAFNKMFPKIKTSYVRLQAGALYAKVLSERQAKSYLVDVIQISDMGMILDFQRRGGFRQYISPRDGRLQDGVQEPARGLLDLGLDHHGRHRLQPQQRAGRRSAQEVGRPARSEVEGRHQRQGLELRPAARRLVRAEADPGRRVLQEVRRATSRAPSTPTSSSTAAWSTARTRSSWARSTRATSSSRPRARRSPSSSRRPACRRCRRPTASSPDGPHPNAAELFMDWFLSPVGQQALSDALLLHSPRADVPAPARQRAAQGHEAAVPGRLERLREGSSGLRQGMGPHRRRAALSRSWRR